MRIRKQYQSRMKSKLYLIDSNLCKPPCEGGKFKT